MRGAPRVTYPPGPRSNLLIYGRLAFLPDARVKHRLRLSVIRTLPTARGTNSIDAHPGGLGR